MRRRIAITLALLISQQSSFAAPGFGPNIGDQANTLLTQIIFIRSAADQIAESSCSYTIANLSNVTVINALKNGPQSIIENGFTLSMPSGTQDLKTPWGTIKISSPTTRTYTVTISQIPSNICILMEAKLGGYSEFSNNLTPCNSNGPTDIQYTYSADMAAQDEMNASKYAQRFVSELQFITANITNQKGVIKTPWCGEIKVGTPITDQYPIIVTKISQSICNMVMTELNKDPHYTNLPDCAYQGLADISIKYKK
jgi:hypothetical protein